jgi:hypothetical protein
VANAGLKVAAFSAICERLVRVAGKGVIGETSTVDSLKLNGKGERQLLADSSQPTVRGKEKDKAEALRTQRFRGEEGDAGRGWKPKFTKHFTALLMTCQVIPYVVMIRMARSWDVS